MRCGSDEVWGAGRACYCADCVAVGSDCVVSDYVVAVGVAVGAAVAVQ